MEPARGLGYLQASRACGAGQRGRFHRRSGHRHAARPSQACRAPVLAGRAAGLRPVRASAGISLVQRQARLPVPPRPHQRSPAQHRTAENTYVREDQILPHLAAVAILLARGSQANGDGTRQLTTPAETAGLVDRLRTAGVILTYDPGTLTIRTRDDDPVAVTMSRNR